MRRLTVGYAMNHRGRHAEETCPLIRLKGLWLKKLGWEIGAKAEVRAEAGRIVISKIQQEEGEQHGMDTKEGV